MRWFVAAVFALSLLGVRGAGAYNLYPTRFDHTCITWEEGYPQLQAMIALWGSVSALTDCGPVPHELADLQFLRPQGAVLAAMNDRGIYGQIEFAPIGLGSPYHGPCGIYIRPDQMDTPWVWWHEGGHCFGIDHATDGTTALMGSRGWFQLEPDDIAAIRALYGPRLAPLRYGERVGVGRD